MHLARVSIGLESRDTQPFKPHLLSTWPNRKAYSLRQFTHCIPHNTIQTRRSFHLLAKLLNHFIRAQPELTAFTQPPLPVYRLNRYLSALGHHGILPCFRQSNWNSPPCQRKNGPTVRNGSLMFESSSGSSIADVDNDTYQPATGYASLNTICIHATRMRID